MNWQKKQETRLHITDNSIGLLWCCFSFVGWDIVSSIQTVLCITMWGTTLLFLQQVYSSISLKVVFSAMGQTLGVIVAIYLGYLGS